MKSRAFEIFRTAGCGMIGEERKPQTRRKTKHLENPRHSPLWKVFSGGTSGGVGNVGKAGFHGEKVQRLMSEVS
jgi:hypothetical protein